MSQPGDDALDCAVLQKQIAENDEAAKVLLTRDKQVERANVAKGVGAAIPYVGILIGASTDLSNEEQVKARAIIDRNEWLTSLAQRKGCQK